MSGRLHPPMLAIGMMAGLGLAYEMLLLRLFAIIQWHHFAYMVISLALLGYGLSGAFLVLFKDRLLPRFDRVFSVSQGLFAVSAVGGFLLAQRLPFNPEALLFDPRQALWLLLMYVLFCLPFFFVATCTALALARFSDRIGPVYAADLFGAGVGSVGILVVLFALFPNQALLLIASLAILATGVARWEMHRGTPVAARSLLVSATVAALLYLLTPADWMALRYSPYKGLSQTLNIHGTRVVDEYSSPLGLLTVVESREVPFRHAPGLSLTAGGEPPNQLGVFTDGDNMSAISAGVASRQQLAYLDQLTSALPFHLATPASVLVLGAGTGADVLQARYFSVPRIDAVELNPQVAQLVQGRYGEFSGRLYSAPGVNLHIAEARGFVAGSRARYDLIQLSLLDAFGASAAGLYALNESYLYTVEAFGQYLAHLSPQGVLAITRWVELPPRDALKVFATASEALRRRGVAEPGSQMMMIRGWQTATVLVKASAFSAQEIAVVRRFCQQRLFDLAYYPGIRPGEDNIYNILPQPYYSQATKALLGPARAAFLERYKYDLRPPTDDRPYHFHFFKWGVLKELLRLKGQGGLALLEWGYLVLAATLVQAVVVSSALVLLPLWWQRRRHPGYAATRGRLAMFGYFFALGLGFLFMEMAFMQKFILFLHHPLYAAGAVICSFLVFAGLGSRYSARYASAGQAVTAIRRAIAGIVVVGAIYLVLLAPLFNRLLELPMPAKLGVAMAVIAPLAFCMGMPFALGMARLAACAPQEIPWAWGVNGCASVVSAVLATLLAIQIGFSGVVLGALLIYLVAMGCAMPRWGGSSPA